MAKAQLKLSDGTIVQIDGSVEEIKAIIGLHKPLEKQPLPRKEANRVEDKNPKEENPRSAERSNEFTIAKVADLIHNCEEAEKIEKNILERDSVINRALLPLYIAHNYVASNISLTTGEVSKILFEINVGISTANVSHCFGREGRKYVLVNGLRKRGSAIGYKLSRRGISYLKNVIENKPDD